MIINIESFFLADLPIPSGLLPPLAEEQFAR